MASPLVVAALVLAALTLSAPLRAAAADTAFSDRSDEELTALAADWDALDRHARRALLTEMKLRMARKGERRGVLHIRTERRYGRIIRQPDGRMIRIETQVVHVRPVDPNAVPPRQSFGVGFERRIGEQAGPGAGVAAAETAGTDAANDEKSATGPRPLRPPQPVPPRLPIYQVSDPEP